MVRSFTIFEKSNEKGSIEYLVSGDLPIEEVARALVIIALNTELPKKEISKGDSSEPRNK